MLALLATLLPVVACPTTDGIPDATYDPLPATVEIAGAGEGLAVYMGAFGGPPYVVAPRGWKCEASIGANTSTHFLVTHGRDRIELSVFPACLICQLGVACPYFPAAAKAMREEFPETPCSRKPRKGLRQVAPDLVRSSSGFVRYGSSGTADARCSLGPRCGPLLDAMLAGIRKYFKYPD